MYLSGPEMPAETTNPHFGTRLWVSSCASFSLVRRGAYRLFEALSFCVPIWVIIWLNARRDQRLRKR